MTPRAMARSLHLLVIEDDDNLRLLLDTMLRPHYAVTTRADGMAAMAWLAEGHLPDLVLADLGMPRLNGAEFLENLRVSGLYRHLPVIILSGKGDAASARQLLERGANDTLVKPFSREELFAVLDRNLPARQGGARA